MRPALKVVKVKLPNQANLESDILSKRSKITASDVDRHYMYLQQTGLKGDALKVKHQQFKDKVKRAIQLPDQN